MSQIQNVPEADVPRVVASYLADGCLTVQIVKNASGLFDITAQ